MSELPSAWTMTTIGAVAKVKTGKTPPTSNKSLFSGEIPFFKPGDLEQSSPLQNAEEFLSPEGSKVAGLLPKGTVLVTCIGNLGKVGLTESDASCNQQINAVLPSEKLLPKYVFYWAKQLKPWLTENASATTVTIINKGRFERAPIPLPPLATQRRIVARLDALFARSQRARAELAHVPRLVERARQAVLAQAFSAALQTASHSATLGDIATQVRNGVGKRPENYPPGVPILKISAIRPMVVRMEEIRYYVPAQGEDISSFALQSGDLLFTRYNGNPDLVANCGMIRNVDGILIYPDKLIRVRVNREVTEPRFIEALASTIQARDGLIPYIKSAAGQHGIAGSDLKRLSLPIPPLLQQHEIVARIEAAFARIERGAAEAARAAALLERMEQAALAKAFRGELVE